MSHPFDDLNAGDRISVQMSQELISGTFNHWHKDENENLYYLVLDVWDDDQEYINSRYLKTRFIRAVYWHSDASWNRSAW